MAYGFHCFACGQEFPEVCKCQAPALSWDNVRKVVAAFKTQSKIDTERQQFIETIARMETESEYDDRTGDGMSGDDAVDAVSNLIHQARALLGGVDA